MEQIACYMFPMGWGRSDLLHRVVREGFSEKVTCELGSEELHCDSAFHFQSSVAEPAEVQGDQAICSRSKNCGVKQVKFKSQSI